MGIAIHNLSSSGEVESTTDLAAAVRQTASGLLGTTVQLADLVRRFLSYPSGGLADIRTCYAQVIPFVAGGFMYIGAVAVLPTYVLHGLDLHSFPGSHSESTLADYSRRAKAASRRCAR